MMKIWNKNTGPDFKVNNMKYWHPHLPFGQHISVSTLALRQLLFIKKNINFVAEDFSVFRT